jgi:hypothetical protein
MARLAAGPWSTPGVRAGSIARVRAITIVCVHNYACDDAGASPERCTDCHLWDGVLIAVMMTWLTSMRHCSAASGEAFGPGGLLRSTHAMTSVAMGPTTGGGVKDQRRRPKGG